MRSSADTIINPEAPLALRLSGQLLLGVVKVHSRKVGYLFQDCKDALGKIKQVGAPHWHLSPQLSLPSARAAVLKAVVLGAGLPAR